MAFWKYSFIGDLKRRIQIELLRWKWHKRNKHNDTTIKNVFDIDCAEVGNYTYGYLYVMSSTDDCKLKIGNYVSIASDVKFLLCGEHILNSFSTFPITVKVLGIGEDESYAKGDIIVEDDVWIGQNAIILSGVRIGQGAVIAAGSVVTKDVEPYAIVGGNPAHVLRKRFPDELIDEMKKIEFDKIPLSYLKENKEKIMRKIECKEQIDWLMVDTASVRG